MISETAADAIRYWTTNANSDLQIRTLSTNMREYANCIHRFVAPSRRVNELLDRALATSRLIIAADQNDDRAGLARERAALANTLDDLTNACREAGLSDEARALGS
ncbi:hypothetical protein ATER59S_04419 [Aquamicrobium terrae]